VPSAAGRPRAAAIALLLSAALAASLTAVQYARAATPQAPSDSGEPATPQKSTPPAKPAGPSTAKPAVKAASKPAAKAGQKSGTKPAAKPVAQPAATAAPKSTAKPVHKQAHAPHASHPVAHRAAPPSATPSVPAAADPEAAREQQREQAAQRDELIARLAALKKDIANSEASRSEAADALAASEEAISETNRKLHELGVQQTAVESRLGAIADKRAATERAHEGRRADLARMLHDQYEAGPNDALRLLLSGDDPSRIERDLQYRAYIGQAQANLLLRLEEDLADLATLAQQAQQQNDALAGIATDQKEQRANLVREQDSRRQALAQVSEKLEAQRVQASVLERDEKRLSDVVEELGKLIERQARERERQRAALIEKQREEEARRASSAKNGNAGNESTSANSGRGQAPSVEEGPPPIAYAGNFAALRGKLHLPVRGDISGHFGAARGGGGPTWKGVFIRADSGSEVHAIAPGRVVFAEWLRGFGNLLIIDHGEEYLSIYGNNEALLKQPGDSVQSGEQVATVGNSGGIEQTGLYFEMRYQGKPFDPLAWAAPR
jgi:septal ring factor EnvC (AmiA/AmiB activator)